MTDKSEQPDSFKGVLGFLAGQNTSVAPTPIDIVAVAVDALYQNEDAIKEYSRRTIYSFFHQKPKETQKNNGGENKMTEDYMETLDQLIDQDVYELAEQSTREEFAKAFGDEVNQGYVRVAHAIYESSGTGFEDVRQALGDLEDVAVGSTEPTVEPEDDTVAAEELTGVLTDLEQVVDHNTENYQEIVAEIERLTGIVGRASQYGSEGHQPTTSVDPEVKNSYDGAMDAYLGNDEDGFGGGSDNGPSNRGSGTEWTHEEIDDVPHGADQGMEEDTETAQGDIPGEETTETGPSEDPSAEQDEPFAEDMVDEDEGSEDDSDDEGTGGSSWNPLN